MGAVAFLCARILTNTQPRILQLVAGVASISVGALLLANELLGPSVPLI